MGRGLLCDVKSLKFGKGCIKRDKIFFLQVVVGLYRDSNPVRSELSSLQVMRCCRMEFRGF